MVCRSCVCDRVCHIDVIGLCFRSFGGARMRCRLMLVAFLMCHCAMDEEVV